MALLLKGRMIHCLRRVPRQAPSHPFSDMLSLNSKSGSSPTANLLVDVFSDNSAPPAAEASEENFHRYRGLSVALI